MSTLQEKKCPVPGCNFTTSRWDVLADHIASCDDPAHSKLYEFLAYGSVADGRCILCGEEIPYRSKRHGITTQLKHYIEKHLDYLVEVVLQGFGVRYCENCGTVLKPLSVANASGGDETVVVWICERCGQRYVELLRKGDVHE